ncbi:conserved hypothetical protein [Lodderomyces elongisporus NRRL YB-4239]|uniref:Major facilitator superfamily (MFS) profile domain-containing protein n=1 Tax=Lodderomyces elongisporus (strain ATCC 11503 / CBS 2605 / JCM 1781 / NBRC 1676 / NRRL YB-4239) TaxID=379508 RepID=A5E797_LODEL|nr:conserved hypothetical protein [Lodderomyces elongisporus NRRL YB-4239]
MSKQTELKETKEFVSATSSISEEVQQLYSESCSPNPFLDPHVAEYYKNFYNEVNYECREAFDPSFQWTREEEKQVVCKLNWRVAFAACLMFVALQIDRGNIQQAVSDNFLQDLRLTTNDFNTGNTIFYVSFLVAEVPSQMLSKALGPDIFIPIQICAWSIVALSQVALQNKTGFYITRALIGAIEGGFIADLVLWLSYFFTSKELPIRLSWFWTTMTLTQVLAALAAFGILRLRGVFGWPGWRHLFLWEGLFTLGIGLLSFYMMVPSAVQTKNWMHPKGWFTEREEKIVVNRVLRDDPTKGSMHNRQAMTLKEIWKCLIDYDMWPLYAIGLVAYIGYFTFGSYFVLLTRQLGFGTLETNLLTIPQAVLAIVMLLFITWFSEKLNNRALVSIFAPVYGVILLGVIRFWPGSGVQAWPSYVLNTLYSGHPFIHAILVSWVSRNSNSVRTRSICSALYNMFVQADAIIAMNIFRADDYPLYKRGLLQLWILTLLVIPLLLLTKWYYIWRNQTRERIWGTMSEDEKDQYRKTTKDEGNKRLDFRFDH